MRLTNEPAPTLHIALAALGVSITVMLQALQQRRDSLSEVKQLIAEAAREADLMQPVAARKARRAAAEVCAR
jgi:hypothetical protein